MNEEQFTFWYDSWVFHWGEAIAQIEAGEHGESPGMGDALLKVVEIGKAAGFGDETMKAVSASLLASALATRDLFLREAS